MDETRNVYRISVGEPVWKATTWKSKKKMGGRGNWLKIISSGEL
jgi:hypothetical protein